MNLIFNDLIPGLSFFSFFLTLGIASEKKSRTFALPIRGRLKKAAEKKGKKVRQESLTAGDGRCLEAQEVAAFFE